MKLQSLLEVRNRRRVLVVHAMWEQCVWFIVLLFLSCNRRLPLVVLRDTSSISLVARWWQKNDCSQLLTTNQSQVYTTHKPLNGVGTCCAYFQRHTSRC